VVEDFLDEHQSEHPGLPDSPAGAARNCLAGAEAYLPFLEALDSLDTRQAVDRARDEDDGASGTSSSRYRSMRRLNAC
jgi:hypothetical protein